MFPNILFTLKKMFPNTFLPPNKMFSNTLFTLKKMFPNIIFYVRLVVVLEKNVLTCKKNVKTL